MTLNNSRLMLGSAQWGFDYGISNTVGKTREEEVKKILEYARRERIRSVDTASGYGNAEKVIGKLKDKDNEITTKLSIGCQDQDSELLRRDVEHKVSVSKQNIRTECISAVLVHDRTT